ncbi:hypothetical protein P8452_16730 [Trifolium repens]|nr:hypothetical protein P8452_16730 [Trifolium repens]
MVHLRRSSPSAAAGAGAHPFPCRKGSFRLGADQPQLILFSQVRLVFVNRENDIILLDDDDPWQFRWINYLGPDIKRGHFTNEEEENIIKLHEIGNSS